MPTLDWIGRKAVDPPSPRLRRARGHHRQVPFHLLRDVAELSVGDPGSGNLIVEGDNLVALKALLPYYAGQVKCIYIDPPYNTGNEGWVYNDNVNSPIIREWLGKTVGKEAEDLSRHDKWLCGKRAAAAAASSSCPAARTGRRFGGRSGARGVGSRQWQWAVGRGGENVQRSTLNVQRSAACGRPCFVLVLVLRPRGSRRGRSGRGASAEHRRAAQALAPRDIER